MDDNVDAAESLAMVLTIGGHEVRTAHDGSAGVERFRAFGPDVVLLDLGMPGIDRHLVKPVPPAAREALWAELPQ